MTDSSPTKRTRNSRLRGAAEPPAVAPPPPHPTVGVTPAPPPPPVEQQPAQVHVDQAPAAPSVLPPGLVGMALTVPAPAPAELPTVDDIAKVAAPAAPEDPQIAGTPFRMNDVVQVNEPGNRHYGVFFVVSDARHGKIHGWYMMEGLKKEFITMPVGSVHYIGSAKVRTRVGCSPKWLSDNR